MYKKILSCVLVFSMLTIGTGAVQALQGYDFGPNDKKYIMVAKNSYGENVIETEQEFTYNPNHLNEELKIKSVSMTEKEAEKLSKSNCAIIEEDIVIKAETIDDNQYLYNYEGIENELYEEENLDVENVEEYTWNIPFVRGTEQDTSTLGKNTIKVGILDSGISNSDEFSNVERIDLVPNTTHDSLGIYNDVTGHGTNVAGIIAANKNEYGIIGIAPNVSLYSIRVLDEDNMAPISRIIAGIEWAIENDIDVLNMSFGTSNYSSLFYQTIRKAYESGMVLVASAGNTGTETNEVTYPAKFDEVISVGSCDEAGARSDFSPQSEDIDILAPGEYIESTGLIDGYSTESGTSLAAPHVTAAVALVLSADNTKNNEFIKQLLKSTANVSVNETGILDIKCALETLPDFEDVEIIVPTAIPENTEDISEFDVSYMVVGSWSKTKHSDLIYDFSNPSSNVLADDNGTVGELGTFCETTAKNIMLFARAAYDADTLYGFKVKNSAGTELYRFSPLHALGYTPSATSESRKLSDGGSMNSNYLADTKYLYRLARHYFDSTSVADADASISDVTIANANYQILRKIVSSSTTIYTRYDNVKIEGIVHEDIIDGYVESDPETAGWKILGLAAHLAGDAYAHRTRVPLSAANTAGKVFYNDYVDGFNYYNHDSVQAKDPDEDQLDLFLKEQFSYSKPCVCYTCFKGAVSRGNVEMRDLSGTFLNSTGLELYDCDSTSFYGQRYTIATKHAVKKLITQFNDSKGFTLFVFLPADSTGYTLKLNGLRYYVTDTNMNWDGLQTSTQELVMKYSTTDRVV